MTNFFNYPLLPVFEALGPIQTWETGQNKWSSMSGVLSWHLLKLQMVGGISLERGQAQWDEAKLTNICNGLLLLLFEAWGQSRHGKRAKTNGQPCQECFHGTC